MTPERWDRVWSLFEAALERSAPERAALLDAACAGDPELRAEVERYLRADAAAPSLLDAGPGELAIEDLALARADAPSVAGRAVGPYRVIRELGRGGMGVVYLAERADVRKTVALKLVRGNLASPESGERFLLERRVLARLEHPNVARLLDAGVTDDGLPYFAMEYVDGVPITEYCDRGRLPVRARLELFGRVCEAVEYAHRNLVVHRDLKPSNILVTEDGTPKLLDFGIAKLLEGDADEGLTGTGMRLMTPEYAAPEQLTGEPVTTATDVYALGVVLYELLSGHRPYNLRGRSLGEVERLVLQTVPPHPSTAAARAAQGAAERPQGGEGAARRTPDAVSAARRTSPERLRRQLAGDLDTIALKALAKEPQERYASARQLLEDTRRHLAGRPVRARPATAGYRARKFVRRNRWGVGAAAAATLVLLGFTTVTAVQARRITRERDLTALERDKAREVSGFLVQLFSVADPDVSGAEAVTARQLLDEGAARVERELAGQPEVRASMLDAIGRAYDGLALSDQATPPLQRALDLRRQLYRGDHPDIAASLHNLAEARPDRRDLPAAESLLRDALAMRRRLLGRTHPDVAETLTELGQVLRERDDLRGAEALQREAVAVARAHAADRPDLAARALSGLGATLYAGSRYAEAEPVMREALRLTTALRGRDHPAVSRMTQRLALVLHAQGKSHEAEPLFREAVETARRTLGEKHPQYARGMIELADFLTDKGDLRGAEELWRRVLVIERRDPSASGERLARAHYGLGRVLLKEGRPREAEPLLREALAAVSRHDPRGLRAAGTQLLLGQALTALRRYAEAEPLLRDSYARALQVFGGRDHPDVREARHQLVTLYEAWGRPELAEAYRRKNP